MTEKNFKFLILAIFIIGLIIPILIGIKEKNNLYVDSVTVSNTDGFLEIDKKSLDGTFAVLSMKASMIRNVYRKKHTIYLDNMSIAFSDEEKAQEAYKAIMKVLKKE